MKLWIVTNIGGGKNYTPSAFVNYDEAWNHFLALITNNIFDRYGDELASHGIERGSSLDVIAYADKNIDDVWIYGGHKDYDEVAIGELEEGGNVIQLFKIDL